MTKRQLFALAALLAVFFTQDAEACIAEASGDYDNEATWSDASCGVAGIPDDTDDVTIGAFTVTTTGAETANSVTMTSGAILTFANSSSLTVDGNFDCTSSPGTDADDGLDHPASNGGATLTVGGDFDLEFCDPDMNGEEKLNIVHSGTGTFTYNTNNSTQGADRQRYNFYNVTLGTGTTTLVDVWGDTGGRDITAHGAFTLGGGTLTYDPDGCNGGVDSCAWPPTVEVSNNGTATTLYAGSGNYNLTRMEVEWIGATTSYLDLGSYVFQSNFVDFDFTGYGSGDNRGVLELSSDADFGSNASVVIEKSGLLQLASYTLTAGGSLTFPTGSGATTNSRTEINSTVDVGSGKLLVGGACILGDNLIGANPTDLPGVATLDVGTGLVECGTVQFIEATSNIFGADGGRMIATDKMTDLGTDYFGSALRGTDSAAGTSKGAAVDDALECIELIGGATEQCYLRGGEVYSLSGGFTTATNAGDVGIYGDGTSSDSTVFPQGFETRPTLALDADDTFTHSADGTLEYHSVEWRWGTALHAEIGTIRTACTAPCTLIFNAGPSWRGGLTEDQDFTWPYYFWEIDDDADEFWSRGAMADGTRQYAKSEGYGPIFSHYFDTAGTFTLDMTMHDGTTSATAGSVTITIANPDTVFATTSTTCIYESTVGTGCPSGATEQSVGSGAGAFDTAVNTYCNADDARCLFKMGDSFDANGAALAECDNCQLGAYGSGADPIIDCDGVAECLSLCDTSESPDDPMVNSAIWGLSFVGDDTADTKAIFLDNSSAECVHRQITFSDLTIADFAYGINATTSGAFDLVLPETTFAASTTVNDEIAIVNTIIHEGGNTATQDPGNFSPKGYEVFMTAHNATIMGSLIGDKDSGVCLLGNDDADEVCSSNATCRAAGDVEGTGSCEMEEHNIRNKLLVGSFVGHNDLGLITDDGRQGCGHDRTIHTVRGGHSTGSHTSGDHDEEWKAHSRYNYFADQFVGICKENNGWALTLEPTDSTKVANASHTNLIEGYHVSWNGNEDESGPNSSLAISNGLHNVIKNSTFNLERSAGNTNGTVTGVRLWDRTGAGQLNPSADNQIYGLSAHAKSGGTTNYLVNIEDADIVLTTVRNNLIFNEGSHANVDVTNDSGTESSLANNSEVTTEPWGARPDGAMALEDFKLSTSLTGGLYVLQEPGDAENRCRYADGTYDLGAHQLDATQCLSSIAEIIKSFLGGIISGGSLQ